jgi:hypothetical protein
MDWQTAIDRQQSALISVIIALMNSLGLVKGGTLTTLPFNLYRKTLLIIRPAEAAVRRLIMMVAYDMELRGFNLAPRSPVSGLPLKDGADMPGEVARSAGEGELVRRNPRDERHRQPSFNLIDPLKSFTGEAPDYSTFGINLDDETASSNRTPIPAAALGQRLLALKNALDNLQSQARRLISWYAIRNAALAQNRPHRLSPLRPGLPPYYRKRATNPAEEALLDCHTLALYARARRDSS